MNLSYSVAPSALLWTDDLFDYIQSFKSGGFDSSGVYEQFGWLIIPEIEMHGASGPFTGYFAIKAGDSVTPFSILNPLTDVAVWSVVNHLPAVNMLAASNMGMSFLQILAAPTAKALEKLIFQDDDVITYIAPIVDTADDVLRGWAGNDQIDIWGSGGSDTVHGGTGDDRIAIRNPLSGTMNGIAQRLFAYGEAGNDHLQGNALSPSRDHLSGGSGNDTLLAHDGADDLAGGSGNDVLSGGGGGSGDDLVLGGLGADHLTGAAGVDRFIFTWGGSVPHFDSGVQAAKRDVIADFTRGQDLLRLVESSLDPVTLIGDAGFTGENQVRWVSAGGVTTVFVNGDADMAADMAITLLGVGRLTAADFQL